MGEKAHGRLNPGRSLLLAGVILAAVNLRPALTALGPLIGEIQADTGLDAAGAGLVAALPVLCFGIFSGLVPRLGRRFGLEEVLLAAMLALAAGILLRLLPATPFLFLGSAVLGIAIAFSNVLLPGVTKRSFPVDGRRVSSMYVAVLGVSATAASALAIPLSETWLGWRGALAVWAIPALIAAVAWALLVRRRPVSRPAPPKVAGLRALLRSRLAVVGDHHPRGDTRCRDGHAVAHRVNHREREDEPAGREEPVAEHEAAARKEADRRELERSERLGEPTAPWPEEDER